MKDECCGSDTPESTVSEDAEFTAAVAELAHHEKRLLAELAKPEVTREFLEDPGKVLRRMKIPIPAVVAHRLRLPEANHITDLAPQPVVLPNGQTITPRVKVRVVGRER